MNEPLPSVCTNDTTSPTTIDLLLGVGTFICGPPAP
jgi:hypothetical protein